jgi:GR25 family glycosyltransferase involved in LPS biosynthesis
MTHLENNNKLIFVPSGRLGNAVFRYMAGAIVNIINPALKYTLPETETHAYANDFTYYHGLDHTGDDLYHMDPINMDLINMNPVNMKKEAIKNNNILAYNTLGFFKHTIDLDNLTSNLYINKENGHGLYVKKNITLNDDNFFNMFYKNLEYFNVNLAGFFQFDYIYLKFKTQILAYMEEHQNEHFIQTNANERFLIRDLLTDLVLPADKKYDIVIHLRLGDFNGRPDFIEIEHYLTLFESLLDVFSGKRIGLVYQPSVLISDQEYIAACRKWFQDHHIPLQLETNALLIDFNIMKQAPILICSMSTLAWAAAYLSQNIQQCYMPNYNFYGTPRQSTCFHKPIPNTILYNVKTTPIIQSQIKPYIITLPAYVDRLNKLDELRQQLSFIGLDPNIYNGVYGKDIHISDAASAVTHVKHITWRGTTYFYDTRVRLNGKPMTRGEFGCSWSHLNLLRQLVEEEASTNYYLILEDDVELVKPLKELFELLKHIPADADMCHLAQSLWHPFVRREKVNDFFYECEKEFFSHTTAYIISKKGAQKVLNYTKNFINVPADDLYNMMYRLTPDFHFYVPVEHYFKGQDNVLSAIKEIN